MERRAELLGEILVQSGLVSQAELADALEAQQHRMPLASLCYALGLAEEEPLARALSRRHGIPAVVLDRSVIPLDVLDGPAAELALSHRVLPLCEDRRHLFVGATDPVAVAEVLREIEFIRGKTVVPHIALAVTLRRTLRACLRGRERGERLLAGRLAAPGQVGETGSIFVVSEQPAPPPGSPEARAQRAVMEDLTKEVMLEEIMRFDEQTATDGELRTGTVRAVGTAASGAAPPDDTGLPAPVPQDGPLPLVSAQSWVRHLEKSGTIDVIDLDSAGGPAYQPVHDPPARILIVDDNVPSRDLLARDLRPLGHEITAASTGDEALTILTTEPPDLLLIDIMLPDMDGFQICRAVKSSTKYRRVAVVLTSAVIDSGRVTEQAVAQCGADDYFEKPVQVERLKARLQELLAGRGAQPAPAPDVSLERAISLYRSGEIDAAVGELRRGLELYPSSAKHHFVLANLLHRQSLIYEAIDEYEATLELKPDYFPALTRLAYLYYRQGFAAKAIETWRRSLPLCPDPALRQNIEVFMRKLIADMQRSP